MSDDHGTAGGSARREYERRAAKDEARIRDKWGQGRIGSLAVALTDERTSTRVWATGAIGEETVGRDLDAIASDSIRVLHDRRIPRSKANIDHIAVTTGGVWVIDTKRYKGKRPVLEVEGGWIRPRVEKLFIRGSDKTALVDGMLSQLERVRAAVPGIPVSGALCFVDADWPLIGGDFTVRGVEVLWPRKLQKLLTAATGEVDVADTARRLAEMFGPA